MLRVMVSTALGRHCPSAHDEVVLHPAPVAGGWLRCRIRAGPHMTPVEQLRQAVRDVGRSPSHHRLTMIRHRREWPTLWAAIERIMIEEDVTRPRCDGVGNVHIEGQGGAPLCPMCGGCGTIDDLGVFIAEQTHSDPGFASAFEEAERRASLVEFHTRKRKQGWRCKIGGDHDGPCPLIPIWWRHPIRAWRYEQERERARE